MKYLLLLVLASCLVFSGVVPDAKAFKDTNMEELQQKANDGDPAAQTQLGVAYARGTGVEMDQKEAVKWYRKAADQGYVNAQWNLAFRYVRGEGVEANNEQAVDYFRLAADQGYPPAEFDLGMMYLQGMGVSRSRTTALDWITKAADHGYKEAEAFLNSRGVVRDSEATPEEKKD